MSAYFLPQPQQFFDNNGDPLAGGKVYTCIPGSSGYTKAYQKDSYTDATGLVANPNPVVLDSFGRCNVWGDGTNYKLFIFSPNDILIDTIDDVPCLLGSGADIVIAPSDGSVTTPKLADGAVTTIKMADSAVTGTQIADASVQPAKLSTGHPTWDTGGTLSASGFSGPLTGNVTGNVSGNLTGNASTATALSTASGSAPSYAARAWAYFNLSTGNIYGSANISSITHVSTGIASINMTSAPATNNYYAVPTSYNMANTGVAPNNDGQLSVYNRTVGAFNVICLNGSATLVDPTTASVVVFK